MTFEVILFKQHILTKMRELLKKEIVLDLEEYEDIGKSIMEELEYDLDHIDVDALIKWLPETDLEPDDFDDKDKQSREFKAMVAKGNKIKKFVHGSYKMRAYGHRLHRITQDRHTYVLWLAVNMYEATVRLELSSDIRRKSDKIIPYSVWIRRESAVR